MRKSIFLRFVATMLMIPIFAILSACNAIKYQNYYSQRENYINATGIVTSIAYSEDNNALYLGFSNLTPTFDDTCFKIVGNNLQIAQGNGIDEKIKIGDQIDFITAPKYFGDGYVMPIVAISMSGESLLEFEEGFTNFVKWLGAS